MIDYGDFCNELRKGLKEQIELLNETSHGGNELSLEEFANNLFIADINAEITSSSAGGFHHFELIIPLSHNIALKIVEKQKQDTFDLTINYNKKDPLKIRLSIMKLQQKSIETIKDLYSKCIKNVKVYETAFTAETSRRIAEKYEMLDSCLGDNKIIVVFFNQLRDYIEELIYYQTLELKEYIDEKISSLLKNKSTC